MRDFYADLWPNLGFSHSGFLRSGFLCLGKVRGAIIFLIFPIETNFNFLLVLCFLFKMYLMTKNNENSEKIVETLTDNFELFQLFLN